MAINFPNSPSSGDTHTVSGKIWQWDGEKWKAYGASIAPGVLKIDSANNRVGINQTTPTVALDVTGAMRVTGDLTVQGTTTTIDSTTIAAQTSITFEGATADNYETTLTLVDPTADRTITLPNATGTVTLDGAPLASPTFTGVPTAPTASADTSTTQVATTAFVMTEVGDYLLTATAGSTYLPLAGGTLSGAVNAGDQVISKAVFKDVGETLVVNGTSGSTDTIDLEDGNFHKVTLTANCTFTFSNPPASGTAGSFTLFLIQDGTGSRTVTWPGTVDWSGATAPTLTTTAAAVDVLTFITLDGGTIWNGFVAGQAMG
jgi:hypothetical protein